MILGWSFVNTNDSRESAAIYVASNLMDKNIKLSVCDPKVKKNQIYNDLMKLKSNKFNKNMLSILKSVYENLSSINVIAIITEWDEFIDYDWKIIYKKMKKPAYIFDGRNILDKDFIKSIGFIYVGLGKNG